MEKSLWCQWKYDTQKLRQDYLRIAARTWSSMRTVPPSWQSAWSMIGKRPRKIWGRPMLKKMSCTSWESQLQWSLPWPNLPLRFAIASQFASHASLGNAWVFQPCWNAQNSNIHTWWTCLQSKVPAETYAKHVDTLWTNFHKKYLDTDLDMTVAASDKVLMLNMVDFLKPILDKSQVESQKLKIERDAELAHRVEQATFDEVKTHLLDDAEAIRAFRTQQAADRRSREEKLQTHIQKRYTTGLQRTADLMQDCLNVVNCDAKKMMDHVRAMKEKAIKAPGPSDIHVLMLLDLSKFPQDPGCLDAAIEKGSDLCHLSTLACIVCLYPIVHSNILAEALLKKMRTLEDKFMVKGLSMNHRFSIVYDVADHLHDTRCRSQEARLLVPKASQSQWLSTLMARGRLPSVAPLCRVREMFHPGRTLNDLEKQPSPHHRVAQRGAVATETLLEGFLDGLPSESKVQHHSILFPSHKNVKVKWRWASWAGHPLQC